MDFDEHEEQQREHEESGNYQPPTGGNEGTPSAMGGNNNNNNNNNNNGSGGSSSGGMTYRYKHCMKNHAASMGGQAMDGCGEFIAAGEDGTLEALRCAACNCHRNFHRKVLIPQGFINQYPPHPTHFPPYNFRAPHPSGYFHITPPPLPREDENMSNPSSSGGGGGGSKKRHRTKFSQEQKDKMLAFAEKLGWRFQKQDEDAIMQFCNEINVNRQVFKVWMHNNKQSLGKK